MKANIADQMNSLIENLKHTGVNGILFPDIQKECMDEWGEDYAIVCNAYCPDLESMYTITHYFDEDRLIYDFQQMVLAHFRNVGDLSIVVNLHNIPHGSNEIEVHRDKIKQREIDNGV